MSRQARVLVIDDERAVNLAISLILEGAGFRVERAFDGNEALQKFREFEPDALVLDVMMPGQNGYRVSRLIKTFTRTCTKVVLVTGRRLDHDPEREEAMMDFSKADAVVYKPFVPKEIVETVRSVLQV